MEKPTRKPIPLNKESLEYWDSFPTRHGPSVFSECVDMGVVLRKSGANLSAVEKMAADGILSLYAALTGPANNKTFTDGLRVTIASVLLHGVELSPALLNRLPTTVLAKGEVQPSAAASGQMDAAVRHTQQGSATAHDATDVTKDVTKDVRVVNASPPPPATPKIMPSYDIVDWLK